jgi:hypothetical protein
VRLRPRDTLRSARDKINAPSRQRNRLQVSEGLDYNEDDRRPSERRKGSYNQNGALPTCCGGLSGKVGAIYALITFDVVRDVHHARPTLTLAPRSIVPGAGFKMLIS